MASSSCLSSPVDVTEGGPCAMSLKRSNAQEGAVGVRDLVGSQRSIPFLRRLTVPAQVAANQLSQLSQFWHRSPRPMPGIRFDRDVPVTMRDGARDDQCA